MKIACYSNLSLMKTYRKVVASEIPIAILTSVIYYVLWYFPAGLPTDSSSAGYVFLMTMLFFFFQASWGQWICAFAPSFTVISNVSLSPLLLPFAFCFRYDIPRLTPSRSYPSSSSCATSSTASSAPTPNTLYSGNTGCTT